MWDIFKDGALASWVQAAIYLATLIVLYYQLSHLRKQTQTQINTLQTQVDNSKYSDYIRCQSDFTQTMRQLLREDLHEKIYDSLYRKGKSRFNADWTKYEPEDKKVYAFFEIIYELFERVYCIKMNDKEDKVIDEAEWHYWNSWIDDVVEHPIFNDVHVDSLGMFDKDFEDMITTKLKAVDNYRNSKETVVTT